MPNHQPDSKPKSKPSADPSSNPNLPPDQSSADSLPWYRRFLDWLPPELDPENSPDPINQWSKARQRMGDLGLPNAVPIPPGFPGNWNLPPVPENNTLPPYVYMGSPPWNPSQTKPFNGTA